jgi:hypothetical protein
MKMLTVVRIEFFCCARAPIKNNSGVDGWLLGARPRVKKSHFFVT